ncbi:MAG: DUF692 family multinuclear iron-containing protein [Gemmataceae bacterium]
MQPLGVGFPIDGDPHYLSLCQPILEEDADFFEAAPEMFWQADGRGGFRQSPYADLVAIMQERTGKPLVAHGLGLSPGTALDDPADGPRLERWLAQIRRDQHRFDFQWYTEHLGWVAAGGVEAFLHLPLPPTAESRAAVVTRLSTLKPTIPLVGFENQVSYFAFGDVREEAEFWTRMCHEGDLWLLLDLHNAYTQALNYDVPLEEYLAPLDLARVIEIHLAGGNMSTEFNLKLERTWRLDSHAGPVPEPVWAVFERLRPRCPNLRGVVLERLDGSFGPEEVPALRDELRRARRIFEGAD